MPVHGTPSGSLPPLPRLTESQIAQSEAIAPAERVRGETGMQLSFISSHIFFYPPGPKAIILYGKLSG